MLIDRYVASLSLACVTNCTKPEGKKVLDVGSGEGHLSRLLHCAGAKVWATDTQEPHYNSRHINFVQGMWPDVLNQLVHQRKSMDLIVFNYSLQLMANLNQAIEAAKQMLSPNGQIVVNGFAFADVNQRTIDWVYDVINRLEKENLADQTKHAFYQNVKNTHQLPNVALWQKHSTCFSHPVEQVTQTLTDYFETVEVEAIPFFYRHFAKMFFDQTSEQHLEACLEEERRFIAQNKIQGIGRTWRVKL